MSFACLGPAVLTFQDQAEQFEKTETSLRFLGVYKSRQILTCHFSPLHDSRWEAVLWVGRHMTQTRIRTGLVFVLQNPRNFGKRCVISPFLVKRPACGLRSQTKAESGTVTPHLRKKSEHDRKPALNTQ